MSLDRTLSRSEIEAALRATDTGYNIGTAAEDLGIDRRTLMRRMRVLGMARGKAGRKYKPLRRRFFRRSRIGLALGGVAALVLGGIAVVAKRGNKA